MSLARLYAWMEAWAEIMEAQIIEKIASMAKRMRRNSLKLAFSAGNIGAHIGPSLSIIEILAVLYGGVMHFQNKNPTWPDRDRFILSKGHGALAFYTALAEVGIITFDELETFEEDGGSFSGQPVMNMEKGIEFSSGSLGLGLSLGIGVAIAGKKRIKHYNTYILMGDGECNEGTVWEAAMAASHFKLDNLVAIIDHNGMQSDGLNQIVLDIGNLEAKWTNFGFSTIVADGHNIEEMYDALKTASDRKEGSPYAIIAHTTKGKGVSFMENSKEWHHNRITQIQYEIALSELDG
jgi:transketolase